MSLAMLLMFAFPGDVTRVSAPSMAMSSSAGSRLDPGLGFLLAFAFFASAIFTLASPRKGAAHHGSHVPDYALVGSVAPDRSDGSPTVTVANVSMIERVVATPWLEDASHVVMCVAMGLMLILMI